MYKKPVCLQINNHFDINTCIRLKRFVIKTYIHSVERQYYKGYRIFFLYKKILTSFKLILLINLYKNQQWTRYCLLYIPCIVSIHSAQPLTAPSVVCSFAILHVSNFTQVTPFSKKCYIQQSSNIKTGKRIKHEQAPKCCHIVKRFKLVEADHLDIIQRKT